MRALVLLAAALCALPALAQQAADAYYDPDAMAKAREHLFEGHGAQINWLALGEEFEWTEEDELALEAQGWIGGDIHKLWLKTEAEYSDSASTFEAIELQVLYSRAIHPFWDLQFGVRSDAEPGPSRQYATLGVQGLAPYLFEIDAALFLSDEGDVSARFEAEYELMLTQRLILQPKIELDLAASDDAATGVFAGLNHAEAALRLRYEFRREIAPYLGIVYESAYGDARDALRAANESASDTSLVAGIRVWF